MSINHPVNVMGMGDPVALFAKQDLRNLIDAYVREATQAVQSFPADDFLATPTEDLIEHLVEKHSFIAPFLRREEAYIDGPHEVEIRKLDYGDEIRVKGTMLALVIPLDGEPGLLYMNPNRYGGSIRANLNYQNVVLTVRGRNLQTADVNKAFENQINEIEEMLVLQREMAAQHKTSLPQRLRPLIEERKQKLLADRQMVSGLAFPIRSRVGAPKTYDAPVTRKKLQVSRPLNTEKFAPEPVLEESTYMAILDIVQSMTLVMERSPTAFATMTEEDIRQHYLVQLNGQFEGAASGETFNYQGKTDILIRAENRNIFIAECKFWTGEKAFAETIDQILRYLSWRDTKAAIILFSRNKNFSEVLTKAKAAVISHPQYKRGPSQREDTQFRYALSNPTDPKREVTLTVMAFDVPR